MKKNLFLLIAIFFILSACSLAADSTDINANTTKDSLVLSLGNEPEDGFDPTTGWGRYGSPLFHSTLFVQDEQFNTKNDLATNYKISDNGLEWVITIRDDVKFSDGKPLTADDVVFTFETAKESHSIIDLTNLEKVEKLENNQVKFVLKERQSTFIYMLMMIGIVPKHAYSKNYNEQPIGSGPYQLVQWDKGQQLIVEENPNYYGKKPFFKKLTFLFLSDDAAYSAAKIGDIDIVAIPVHFTNKQIDGMDLIALETVDNRGIMFPYVQEHDKNGVQIGNHVTTDEAIRKAINFAIDREKLIEEVLDGYGTPAYSIADKLPWWNEETAFEDGNIDKAIQILEDAGWVINERNIREKDGIEASFHLAYPATDPTRQTLAIAFEQMMEKINIEVLPQGKSWNEIEEVMHSTPVVMGWGSHDPIEMYHVYHSSNIGKGFHNANYYSNEKVDHYLDQALYANNEEKAYHYWQQAQWDGETGFSMIGDAPWAWLVNVQHLYLVNDHLNIGNQKIQPHGHGWPITEFIVDWEWEK